jgi:hypothetical protein
MNCENYLALPESQQKEYLGELIHSVQNDNLCFTASLEIIELAKEKGKFNGVKIGNDAFKDTPSTDDLLSII